jgi:hypothetical protein
MANRVFFLLWLALSTCLGALSTQYSKGKTLERLEIRENAPEMVGRSA